MSSSVWDTERRLDMRTLRRLDTELREPLSLLHGPHDGLDDLLDLLVQTSDIRVLLRGLLIDLHGLHAVVVLCR